MECLFIEDILHWINGQQSRPKQGLSQNGHTMVRVGLNYKAGYRHTIIIFFFALCRDRARLHQCRNFQFFI